MTNWSVGSGGDHATWAAAITALSGVGALADDYTLTQISDTVEPCLAGGGYGPMINLNGHSVVFTSDNPHLGNPNAGWEASGSTSAGTAQGVISFQTSGGGSMEVKNLKVLISSTTNGHVAIGGNITGTETISCHDVMARAGTIGQGHYGVWFVVAQAASSFWNMVASNFSTTTSRGIFIQPQGVATHLLENCTAEANTSGIVLNQSGGVTITVRNCVASGNTTDFTNSGAGDANGYNNASEDGTAVTAWDAGSGNQTAIVEADEFVSTSWSSGDYFKVRSDGGGVCHDGGATPAIAGNTAGIRGNPRPHSPEVSIGADELGIGAGSLGGRPAWAW